jgi:DHA2 family multidrug resistance protein-like MFS transporter
LAHPLLDLGLFRSRTFTVALGTMLLGGIVMAGVSLMSTLHLQVVSALSPMGAGLWMLPVNIGLIAGSLSGPVFAKRFRVSTVVAAGLGVGAFGLLLQSQASASGGLGLVVSVLVLASFGIALPMALTMNLILGATPPEKAGAAASLQETGGEFGVALGVAAMGSLGTLIYRGELSGTTVPDAARESLTAAVTVAQDLPARLAADLLDTARAAFTSGLNVVALAGAVIFAGLAVTVAIVLGGAERSTEPVADVPELV